MHSQALGLDLHESLPDGWTPLEAIVIAKCLDEDGGVNMFHTSTPALNSYEAVGMLRWTCLTLERAITGTEEDE